MRDTPEARQAKRREYVGQLQVWWLLMGWWTLCLAVVLGLLWWVIPGAGVIVRLGLMVFTVIAYIFAVYMPTSLVKPTPHQGVTRGLSRVTDPLIVCDRSLIDIAVRRH